MRRGEANVWLICCTFTVIAAAFVLPALGGNSRLDLSPILLTLITALISTQVAIMWHRHYTDHRQSERKRLGHCDHCGYDLTANVSGTCPECGTPVAKADNPPDVRCSFCGTPRSAAGPMVEGPDGIYMCVACVRAAAKIADEIEQAGATLTREAGESGAAAGRASTDAPAGP